MASTTHEALIAELLGDVGLLHDEIKTLPGKLNGSLAPTLEALSRAKTNATATIDQHAEQQKGHLQYYVAQQKSALLNDIHAAIRQEAGAALSGVSRALEQSARAHQSALHQTTHQGIQWVMIALATGILGGVIGVFGTYFIYVKEEANLAAYGRALGTVWGQLDNSTKSRIQEALRKQ